MYCISIVTFEVNKKENLFPITKVIYLAVIEIKKDSHHIKKTRDGLKLEDSGSGKKAKTQSHIREIDNKKTE